MLTISDDILGTIRRKIRDLDSYLTDSLTLERFKNPLFAHYENNSSLVFLIEKEPLITIKKNVDNIRSIIKKIELDKTGFAVFLAERNAGKIPESLDSSDVTSSMYEKILDKLVYRLVKNHLKAPNKALLMKEIVTLGDNLASLKQKFEDEVTLDELHNILEKINPVIGADNEDILSDQECSLLYKSGPYRSKIGNLEDRENRDKTNPNGLVRYCEELKLRQLLLKGSLETQIQIDKLAETNVNCPCRRGQINVDKSLASEASAKYFMAILTDLEKLQNTNEIEEGSDLYKYLSENNTNQFTPEQHAYLNDLGCRELRDYLLAVAYYHNILTELKTLATSGVMEENSELYRYLSKHTTLLTPDQRAALDTLGCNQLREALLVQGRENIYYNPLFIAAQNDKLFFSGMLKLSGAICILSVFGFASIVPLLGIIPASVFFTPALISSLIVAFLVVGAIAVISFSISVYLSNLAKACDDVPNDKPPVERIDPGTSYAFFQTADNQAAVELALSTAPKIC